LTLGLAVQGDRAALSVTDTGAGVPEDAGDRIFDLYFSTKEQHEGLGLYVARSVVESTRGAIEHSRESAGGSRFTLVLPLAA
jgi:signal transduction histidine kinase